LREGKLIHPARLTDFSRSSPKASSITLIECVNNFLRLSGASIPQALKTVTATPASMLDMRGVKGTLDAHADADLVVLSESVTDCATQLHVDEVWKFGKRIWTNAHGI
jgi:N-acetylglucosamine-6-phosphate deacetylase